MAFCVARKTEARRPIGRIRRRRNSLVRGSLGRTIRRQKGERHAGQDHKTLTSRLLWIGCAKGRTDQPAPERTASEFSRRRPRAPSAHAAADLATGPGRAGLRSVRGIAPAFPSAGAPWPRPCDDLRGDGRVAHQQKVGTRNVVRQRVSCSPVRQKRKLMAFGAKRIVDDRPVKLPVGANDPHGSGRARQHGVFENGERALQVIALDRERR